MVLNPCRDSHECQNLDPGGFLEEEDHKRWAEPAWHRFLLSRPPWALARTRGLDGSRGPDPALSHWPAFMPGQGWPFVHTPLLILQALGRTVQSQGYCGVHRPQGSGRYTKLQVIQCHVL